MSRFDNLLKQAKDRAAEPDDTRSEPAEVKTTEPATAANPPPALSADPPKKKMGRPKAKKSDPAYEQVTAYVPRELYGNVRSVLFKHHDRKEFSTLVSELLEAWLDGQTFG